MKTLAALAGACILVLALAVGHCIQDAGPTWAELGEKALFCLGV